MSAPEPAAAEGAQPAQFEYALPQYERGLKLLIAEKIVSRDGRRVGVEDGDAYVAAWPDVYRGSRFWAEEVAEEESG